MIELDTQTLKKKKVAFVIVSSFYTYPSMLMMFAEEVIFIMSYFYGKLLSKYQ